MAITVKHKFVSAIPDGTDATVVRPSNWNDDHDLTGAIPVANGGTGATTLTGYVYGNGTATMTASTTVPSTAITGLGTMSTQNANAVAVTGGSVDGTTIGTTTASNAAFTYASTNSTTNTTPALSYNASNSSFVNGATIANSYLQNIMQNKSATAGASTNFAVSNNLGTDSTYYGEFGMNSSVFSAGTPADFFSLNNGIYYSGHDGDLSYGSGNGYKTYFAWGTTGQSAHVINVTGAIGLNTNLGTTPALSGTTNFGTSGQVLTSGGSAATPTWTTPTTGTVTSVTGTAPVVSSGGATPAISMPAATTSVSGYLTSTDWTTFNNKGSGTVTSVAAITLGTTGTDLSSTVATGTTTPVITLQVPTASATNRGVLSAADWTTFNNKGSGTVTAVSVVSANGFAGTSSGGATPALTLTTSITGVLKGNATAISAATSGTDYSLGTSALTTGILKSTTTTGALSIAVAADFPTLNQNTTGTAANVTGVVAAANGGTGQSVYAVGDIVYASTTTALSKLADVATGSALISGGVGVAPSYGKIGLTTHVSGTLPIANGGTNATTASITSFNNITGYTASGATGTTSTNLVFSTAPTVTNPTLTGFIETVYAATGTTPALSPTNGTIQTWTLSGASTPTAGTWTAGASLSLQITASTNTITWSSMPVTWMGGTAPTLSTTVTTNLELWKIGTTIYGALVGLA